MTRSEPVPPGGMVCVFPRLAHPRKPRFSWSQGGSSAGCARGPNQSTGLCSRYHRGPAWVLRCQPATVRFGWRESCIGVRQAVLVASGNGPRELSGRGDLVFCSACWPPARSRCRPRWQSAKPKRRAKPRGSASIPPACRRIPAESRGREPLLPPLCRPIAASWRLFRTPAISCRAIRTSGTMSLSVIDGDIGRRESASIRKGMKE